MQVWKVLRDEKTEADLPICCTHSLCMHTCIGLLHLQVMLELHIEAPAQHHGTVNVNSIKLSTSPTALTVRPSDPCLQVPYLGSGERLPKHLLFRLPKHLLEVKRMSHTCTACPDTQQSFSDASDAANSFCVKRVFSWVSTRTSLPCTLPNSNPLSFGKS